MYTIIPSNLTSQNPFLHRIARTPMDELPPEITTNILSRLKEFKCIGQCRCVSKLWHSILSDSTSTTHLSKTTPDLLLHFHSKHSLSRRSPAKASCVYYLEDIQEPLHPFKLLGETFLTESFHDKDPYIVGSCKGFVCLLSPLGVVHHYDYHGHYSRTTLLPRNPICVFNPITEQHFKLPPVAIPEFDRQLREGYRWLWGFGLDGSKDSKNEYKFVFITLINEGVGINSMVQVHTLGSTSWRRKIGTVPNALQRSHETVSSTFVNGSLHWITHGNAHPLIVSFNLGVEEFGFVPNPKYQKSACYKHQLGLLEECLSFVECTYEQHFHVWVMKDYNVRESWVKQYSIHHQLEGCFGTPKLIKVLPNDEILLLFNNQYLVSYNTLSRKGRFLHLEWARKKRRYLLDVLPIVGNLISVKEAFGVDCGTSKKSKT